MYLTGIFTYLVFYNNQYWNGRLSMTNVKPLIGMTQSKLFYFCCSKHCTRDISLRQYIEICFSEYSLSGNIDMFVT